MHTGYVLFTRGQDKKTLDMLLQKLIKDQSASKKDIAVLSDRCDTIEKHEISHIQKVGLLRFNPFKDTGGDQSFVLSLGDRNNSGVILTGLYSRSGVRLYVKRVKNGAGVDIELSEDEKKALREMGHHHT